ncbi:unnamed protein product [Dovyalis caffra]|uniref:Uncharacterized protein n=1 Tax=Dovyalis caffra TaxID=77055 RepID=A0AAV1QYV4_9ROSI|nr:unnamed protein product [Dovyalis caffra]
MCHLLGEVVQHLIWGIISEKLYATLEGILKILKLLEAKATHSSLREKRVQHERSHLSGWAMELAVTKKFAPPPFDRLRFVRNDHRCFTFKIDCPLVFYHHSTRVFVGEQKLHTRAQFNRMNRGDSEVDGDEIDRGSFLGRPICDLCGEQKHMTKDERSAFESENETSREVKLKRRPELIADVPVLRKQYCLQPADVQFFLV